MAAKQPPPKRPRTDNPHSSGGRSGSVRRKASVDSDKARWNPRKPSYDKKAGSSTAPTPSPTTEKRTYKHRQNDRKPKAARASLRQFAWLISAKKARHDARERREQEQGRRTQLQATGGKEKGKVRPIQTIEPADSVEPSSSSSSSSSPPPRTFKIVAGSYEKLLYGLEGTFTPCDPTTAAGQSSPPTRPTPTLKPIFIFPAHVGCVKAVSASPAGGKWLATSSTDEIIKVWDLRRKKEVGALVHHTGSVTQLTFPSPSHLLSASEDGTLALFSTKDWIALRTFKGHKGRINCVAVHPSGKVALSVGRDRTIRMWDFMRGKASLSTKIGKEAELVRWAPSGTLFAVQAGSTVDIYTTNMALIHTINHPARVQDIKFISRVTDPSSEILLVSGEDKKVSVYDAVAAEPKDSSVTTVKAKKTKPVKEFEAASTLSSTSTSANASGEGADPNIEVETGDADRDAGADADADEDESGGDEDSDEDETHIAYQLVAEFLGHESRVKAMDTLQVSLPTSLDASPLVTTYLTTISSDGKIHVYDCADVPPHATSSSSPSASKPSSAAKAIHPIARYDTKGSRLTCVAFADGEVPLHVNGVAGKRKRVALEGVQGADEDEDEDDDDESEEGEASEEDSNIEDELEEGDDGWGGVT
ncbi:hypothetical protein FRB98_005650 [Tulasnella sp. 332]|nr:hypothetical protein FRB98_005650 [Tulasnella sp. 332]